MLLAPEPVQQSSLHTFIVVYKGYDLVEHAVIPTKKFEA